MKSDLTEEPEKPMSVEDFKKSLPKLTKEQKKSLKEKRSNRLVNTGQMALAIEGITSFSVAPLRFISALGFAVFFISTLVSLWAVYTYFFADSAIPGWTSSVLPMYLLGGVQLLSLGMIGEYVAKTYIETKRRPRYIIMEQVSLHKNCQRS